jgi:prepilin-type N-terminal cleavage/methylation domain-containing protein
MTEASAYMPPALNGMRGQLERSGRQPRFGLLFKNAGTAGALRRGFTLIEIMVVVGIMAVVMAISIPFAYHALHRDAFNQTLRDIEEILANARAQAILQGSMAEVIIRKDTFSLSAPVSNDAKAAGSGNPMEASLSASPESGRSARLSEKVGVAALKINGVSFMDADEAHVKFYPNGTSDELRMVMINLDNNETRGLFLEVTTGLATIESDRNKLSREIK